MLSSATCFEEGPHRKCRGRHKAASYNFHTLGQSADRSASSTTEYQPARSAREPKHGRFENHDALPSGNAVMLVTAMGIAPCIKSHQPSGRPVVERYFQPNFHSPYPLAGPTTPSECTTPNSVVLFFPTTVCNVTMEI